MVSLIVNSLGVVDETEYTQLTNKAHYTQGTQAQYPYFDFSGPMWVVSKNSQLADKKSNFECKLQLYWWNISQSGTYFCRFWFVEINEPNDQ